MAEETQDLASIIATSMGETETLLSEKIPGDKLETVEKPKVENKEVTPKEETIVIEDQADDLGLSKADVLQARQLLAGLKDPKKAPAIVKFLVDASGIETPTTVKEVKAAKKALTQELKEALGDDLAFVADKMGPILEKYLKEEVDEVQQRNEARFNEQALEKNVQAADAAQIKIYGEYFANGQPPQEFINQLTILIDEIPPRQGETTESFLRDRLFIAAGRLGKPLTKIQSSAAKPSTAKIEKNRNDVASRLASDGKAQPIAGREVSTRTEVSQPMSLEQAIRTGLEQTNAALQMEN